MTIIVLLGLSYICHTSNMIHQRLHKLHWSQMTICCIGIEFKTPQSNISQAHIGDETTSHFSGVLGDTFPDWRVAYMCLTSNKWNDCCQQLMKNKLHQNRGATLAIYINNRRGGTACAPNEIEEMQYFAGGNKPFISRTKITFSWLIWDSQSALFVALSDFHLLHNKTQTPINSPSCSFILILVSSRWFSSNFLISPYHQDIALSVSFYFPFITSLHPIPTLSSFQFVPSHLSL